jgi:hypothetical protein
MYKLYKTELNKTEPDAVMTVGVEPCKSFIFDPANTDYQEFKKEVLAGAELQDSEGVVMTQEQANEFIASLP